MQKDATAKFPRIAGHAALDLVDTVHWRLDESRAIDTLSTYESVLAWTAQMDVLACESGAIHRAAAEDPAEAAREVTLIAGLREAIYDAVLEQSITAAQVISREYVGALRRASFERAERGDRWLWRVPDDLTGPRAAIALLAQDLLASDLSRVRQCSDNACGWLYLDNSPRRNRIWCTASGCGNRNRVARHLARTKSG